MISNQNISSRENNTNWFSYTNNNDTVPCDIERVVVHQSVTIIRDNAFSRRSMLTSLSLPDNVTTIEESAFYDCSSLSFISIPNSVTIIGPYAFHDCSSLRSITIPNRVKIIGYSTFNKCSSLSAIDLPDSVTTIGCRAFQSCSSLASVVIPGSVTSIEEGTFRGCSSLASVTLHDRVTGIGHGAFCRSFSLTHIVIPDGMLTIGNKAFYGCSSLSLIAIPKSVTTIGPQAFFQCRQLDRRQPHGSDYNPSIEIWLQKRFMNMPIHQACYNSAQNMTTNLLMNLVQANKTKLASSDAMGMTALHIFCGNPNATLDTIKVLKDAYPVMSSTRNVVGMTPLMTLLKCKGIAYNDCYVDGQLVRLARLLELGIKCDVLEIIMGAFDDKMTFVSDLESRNEESNLFPFMQAASLSQCALDVVYMLASKRPDLLWK